jgi:hypothetical protein
LQQMFILGLQEHLFNWDKIFWGQHE